jgi:hypothetical protein
VNHGSPVALSDAYRNRRGPVHQVIYLIGLIVVIMAILSFFGLR